MPAATIYTAPAAVRMPPTDAAFFAVSTRFLGILAALTLLLVSPQLLTAAGIAYAYPGGTLIEKFHPSTYIISLAFLTLLFAGGNPVAAGLRQLLRFPDVAAFVLVSAALAVLTIWRFGISGAAFYIDTLLAPALFLVVFVSFPLRTRLVLFNVLLILIVANSALGIGEFFLHERIIPFTISGQAAEFSSRYFRATGLFGHPLSNAAITAVMLPYAMFLAPSRILRVVSVFVMFAGLLAFNGRLAFALSSAFIGLAFVCVAVRDLAQGRFRLAHGIGYLVALTVVPTFVVILLFGTDLGDRIANAFLWDSSAQARVESLKALSYLNSAELLFGIAPEQITFIKDYYLAGLTAAIENSWAILLMRFGIVGFVPFILCFLLFLRRLWVLSPGVGKLSVLMFLILVTSTPTLGVQSTKLSFLVVLAACAAATTMPSAKSILRRRVRRDRVPTARHLKAEQVVHALR